MNILLKTLVTFNKVNKSNLKHIFVQRFQPICSSSCRQSFKITDLSLFADNDTEDSFVKNEVNELVENAFQIQIGGCQVFVIQPFIKWGPLKKHDTTPELQMVESVALINTLRDWKVVGQQIVSLYNFEGTMFFGQGKLDELKQKIIENQKITAIFVSVNMLKSVQHDFLEDFFSIPVYDRYLIVMQIFREHATTHEAKLQIAMAEIPYMYSRMNWIHASALSRIGGSAGRISGTTRHSSPDTRKLILHSYEKKLKSSLEKLRNQRDTNRRRRKKLEHPVVAVIGYTNAGKTSLIKVMTKSEELNPKNYLFATLDVTFHLGLLPCNLKTFYVDTVGFISDIPAHLIEPFTVTLQDALNADVVLHVQDVSHPDWLYQRDKVNETLLQLNIEKSLLNHVIPVANKIDLLNDGDEKLISSDTVKISCSTSEGIDTLKLRLEEELISATGRRHVVIRVKTGGDEFSWLRSETTVADTIADSKNTNYSLCSVIITESGLDKFKRTFLTVKSN